MSSLKPIHRDDLSNEVIQELQLRFPGTKIVCVGDMTEGSLPAELQKAIKDIQDRFENSIMNGTCLDCGAKISGYPMTDSDEEWDNFELPSGWCYFTDIDSGEPRGFQCPECDAKERSE
jgi:hypothetical protein